ncbi:MAG: response regulator [Rhodoferax sp.]
MNPKLQAHFDKFKSSGLLPSPKGPALAVVELTRQDDTTNEQLARAIQADPALVARLLKLANACRRRTARPVLSVKDAIGILGLNAVRGLALGFSLMKDSQAHRCRAFNYPAFWSRNLARATAMQALTTFSRLMQSDEAFCLGLLAQIGELGLASLFAEDYSRLLGKTPDTGAKLLERERQAFEFDHADLSAALLADWGFPASLIEPVRLHEQTLAASITTGTRTERLLLTLMLASEIAAICQAQPDARRAMMANLLLLGGQLSIEADDLMALCDAVVRDWADWCRLLMVPAQMLPPFADLMNAPAPPVLKQGSGPSTVTSQSGFRVLIVDDSPVIRGFLQHVLGQAGYACMDAENGRLGLELALQEKPDLMVVDWAMPEMDGITLIRKLRESEIGRAIYILLLTGMDQDENLVEAFAAGADDFLAKPPKSSVLLGRLLAGQRVVALHRELKRDQRNLQRFATEFARLNGRLQETRQKDAASQERMELAMRGANLGMWDLHLPTKQVVFSERSCALLGYRPDEIKPHLDSWRHLAHPDDWAAVLAALQRHLKGDAPAYECEHRIRHKDGHWVWIHDRGQVVERDADGSALRVVGTHMDISQRKRTEEITQHMAEQLRRDEERSRDFSMSASDWFWETDAEHCFCYFSGNFEKVYGLAPERLLGRSRQALLQGDALNPPASVAAHLAELAAQQPFKNFEYQIRINGNDVRWVSVSGLPHRDGDGRFAGYRGTGSIVTERKLDEENLRQAMQMAQAANLAKSRFLATMSHEIRTPMNGILGMAQMLLAPHLTAQQHNQYARTILTSGQTLMLLLNDILDLSKIEAGKFQLEATAFEPAPLVHEIQMLFAGAAQAKQLVLEDHWQGSGAQRYQGDAHRLRQMLSNLVGNAIKFTPSGQIRIEGREMERGADSAILEFSVSDSGPGIAADKQDLLFRPFSQTDSSTTREFGGTGLGLSIVRQLAQAMGGDVGVESEAGKGSRFWFRVRVKIVSGSTDSRRLERPTPTVARSADLPNALQGHVLVAEDNPVNCMVIESLLGQLGLNVTLVNDGKQALEAICSGVLVDVVLMDLHMPVMDGYSATAQIRQWEAAQSRARLPIIALTADAFEEDRQHCLAVGMDDFLTKPISMATLKTALAQWLPAAKPAP